MARREQAVPIATGFIDSASLTYHHGEHGQDFNAADKDDYLAQAKAFLEAPLTANSTIREGIRVTSKEIVRYDSATEAFAVVQADGIIKTFYKPMPRHLAPPGTPRRKTHGRPTNLDYFLDTCAK